MYKYISSRMMGLISQNFNLAGMGYYVFYSILVVIYRLSYY